MKKADYTAIAVKVASAGAGSVAADYLGSFATTNIPKVITSLATPESAATLSKVVNGLKIAAGVILPMVVKDKKLGNVIEGASYGMVANGAVGLAKDFALISGRVNAYYPLRAVRGSDQNETLVAGRLGYSEQNQTLVAGGSIRGGRVGNEAIAFKAV